MLKGILAFITMLTLAIGITLATALPGHAGQTYPVHGVVVPEGLVSQCVWDNLLAQGFRGRAGDKREAIYASEQGLWIALQWCGAELVD